MRDSKRGITGEEGDEISDVLLRKMGDIVHTKTQNLSKFPAHLVYEWLLQTGFPEQAQDVKRDGTFVPIWSAPCRC